MRRLALVGAVVVALSAATGVALSAAAGVSAGRGANARLGGIFTMQGRITVAHNVDGERAGQHVRRTWTFYPQCPTGACSHVILKRQRSAKRVRNTIALNRTGPGVYRGREHFWIPLQCGGHKVGHGGLVNERITVRITRTARVGATRYATDITASYDNPSRSQDTRCPGDIGHDAAAYRGHLTVKAVAGTPSGGYLILGADGGVFRFGAAVSQGSESGKLPYGEHAVAMAVQRSTGGYWILNSNGGVQAYNAPSNGSLAGRLHGAHAVAIAASGSAGYLILTSDGGVHPFGGATWHGSERGKLRHGVRAVSLAANASGGYWVLASNGAVYGFGTHPQGSLHGKLHGHKPVQISSDPNGGYVILSNDGGVRAFGKATAHGSDAGKLPSGVRAVSLATDPKTAGYWILKSNGGVDAFHAPWKGSLK